MQHLRVCREFLHPRKCCVRCDSESLLSISIYILFSSTMLSQTTPSALFRRYLKLINSLDEGQFNQGMISTIRLHVGPGHPQLTMALQNYFLGLYKKKSRDRINTIPAIELLILKHSRSTISRHGPPSQQQAAAYTTTMKRKASNMLEQMFLSEFPDFQATVPDGLSPSELHLWKFLSFMGDGEGNAATSEMTCWDPTDFKVLINAGLKVYMVTTSNPANSEKEKLAQFSRLRETVGQHAKDVSSRANAELQLFESQIADHGVRFRTYIYYN